MKRNIAAETVHCSRFTATIGHSNKRLPPHVPLGLSPRPMAKGVGALREKLDELREAVVGSFFAFFQCARGSAAG